MSKRYVATWVPVDARCSVCREIFQTWGRIRRWVNTDLLSASQPFWHPDIELDSSLCQDCKKRSEEESSPIARALQEEDS